ncbi:MAG TPA: putative oxidoreductase C-terminal domain-containing protein [Bryobacteraceae bacterium]|nr:putative oxidoreductase C-terminal domain-containing protein [Bryobacteraceae bacterium]
MPEIRFLTVDPGHFHAALVQKEMYPGVVPQVHVYAPLGPDLVDYLARIARFNTRAERPTQWQLEVHAAPDYLDRVRRERAGNVAVFSGRNHGKIRKIQAAVDAGINALVDKPWVIVPEDLPILEAVLDSADRQGLVAYDIMTERYEITSILQRELRRDSAVFGDQVPGTASDPGVVMESVHHILKIVAGVANPRPAWFFDINEQGEALSDVGTHLVDLTQWTLFPESAIDYRRDIRLHSAARWPTVMTPAQFRQVTGEPRYPAYLEPWIRADSLEYFCNTRVSYELRGVHVKLDVLWNWEAPSGGGDTHYAVYRGTGARLEVRQGQAEAWRPELYVVPQADVATALEKRIAALQDRFPGIGLRLSGKEYLITIPDSYRVGHEAHFAQVTNQFLKYLQDPGQMPAWEKPNMLAKYYVSTQGVAMAKGASSGVASRS